jgi:hypothetical protein
MLAARELNAGGQENFVAVSVQVLLAIDNCLGFRSRRIPLALDLPMRRSTTSPLRCQHVPGWHLPKRPDTVRREDVLSAPPVQRPSCSAGPVSYRFGQSTSMTFEAPAQCCCSSASGRPLVLPSRTRPARSATVSVAPSAIRPSPIVYNKGRPNGPARPQTASMCSTHGGLVASNERNSADRGLRVERLRHGNRRGQGHRDVPRSGRLSCGPTNVRGMQFFTSPAISCTPPCNIPRLLATRRTTIVSPQLPDHPEQIRPSKRGSVPRAV